MRPLLLALLLLAACRSEEGTVDLITAEQVVGQQAVAEETREEEAERSMAAPATAQGMDFELRRATSQDILAHVASSPAQVKIVNFWATWCGPCVEEFPDLIRLQREMRDQGVEVVFVSADFLDQEPDALQFLDRQGATGLSFLKDEKDDTFISAFDDGWSGELPTTILYGPDDAKADVFTRQVTYEGLRQRVLALLTSPSP